MRRPRGRERRSFALCPLAAALAAAACAPSPPPPAARPPPPSAQDREPLLPREGSYHCYFSHQGVDEPRAPCRIVRAAGGALRLEGGGFATRIDGSIHTLDHRSFRFDGSLFAAPGGEITAASGAFEAVDVHVYRGALPTPRGPLWVTVAYIPNKGPKGVTIP